MRKAYIFILLLVAVSFSCTSDFEELNTDTKNPAAVNGDFLFTSAQKELVDQISTPEVNLNVWNLFVQNWTETTYTDEANYDIVNRTIPDNAFRSYYSYVLNRLAEADKLIAEAPVTATETAAVKTNKAAIIELHRIYTYHNLVNIFGDVPYTEAINIEDFTPAYDDASEIYLDLLSRIDAAYATFNTDAGSFGSADIVYEGDIEAWKKFAQSLKLKIAINLADVNPSVAQSNVNAALTAGIFESAADNALYAYQGSAPNTNQIHAQIVLTGRKDFIPANTIVDIMNDLSDPRMDKYFTNKIEGQYLGGDYGYSSAYANHSHINETILEATFPGILITYSELQFYLAEAAARGGYSVTGTPEEYYNEGIKASFAFWGATGVDAYLARPDVAYSSAAGDWEDKIGLQAYISLYTRGLVSYNTLRRLDAPDMNEAPEAETGGPVPTRFTYPVFEQTLNPDNYDAAAAAIGGDDLLTKLFWDIN